MFLGFDATMSLLGGSSMIGKTEDLSTLAGRVKAVKDRDKAKSRDKHGGLKRVVVLAVATSVLTAVGIILRQLSLPTTEDPVFEDSPPQLIRVFTTDPDASVKLILDIESWNNTSADETLFLTVTGRGVTPKTGVLIISTSPQHPVGSKDFKSDLFQTAEIRYGDHLNKVAETGWYGYSTVVGDLSSLPDLFGRGWDVGDFQISDVAQVYRGSFFIHLPSLADAESSYYPLPGIMTEAGGPIRDSVQDLISFPDANNQQKVYATDSVSRLAKDYKALPGTSGHELFWRPYSVSSEEDVWNAGDQVADSHIGTDQPADGHLKDGDLVWQDSGSLEAQFTSTKEVALDSESRWSFYSGIVFGVAAAGLLAVMQELPDRIWLSARRSRRGKARN